MSKIFYLLVVVLGTTFCSYGQEMITRGPYLQKLTQTSVILRWSTDIPSNSKVKYGGSQWGLNSSIIDSSVVLDHSVEITGMDTNRTYFYSVGSTDTLLSGATGNHYFKTLPPKGEENNYTFIALGDAGTGFQGQYDVRDAIINYAGNHYDGVLLLGDNAYQSGTQQEYQDKFFDSIYYQIFENTVIWPAPGNHDYYGAAIPLTPTAPYFDIFDTPTAGECGGIPSGLEQYYSFDYGNIHFVSLDSYGVDRTQAGKMANWLRKDLAADSLTWRVVYWHHPPYSKGSHDSDNSSGNDGHMVQMREWIVPILEEYGVDLVLNGHSHCYERSYLMHGHYGKANTLDPEVHFIDHGTGSYPDDCPYLKYSEGMGSTDGTVYSVVGTSGQITGTQGDWPHPAMASAIKNVYGALILNVDGPVLSAEFLTRDGDIMDTYTIMKDVMFVESGYDCMPIQSDDWILYPNPAIGEVELSNSAYLDQPFERVVLLDFMGRVIERRTDLSFSNTFDTSKLSEGTYTIRIEYGSIKRIFRFVKV